MKKFSALLALAAIICTTTADGHPPTESTDTLSARPTPGARSEITFGIDIMSSYVCRGSYQAGPSFQPSFRFGHKGFFLAAWGSIDFTASQMQEVNLSIGYRAAHFEVAVTDYYVLSSPSIPEHFFRFDRHSAHTFEASLFWTVSPQVPIGIWWGTTFAGADVANNGRRNYSSYAEISYPFKVQNYFDIKTGMGFMPWSTENCFNTKGFAVTNIYLHAARQWTLREKMRIGLLVRLICNPYREQFNLVGGFSFHI